MRGFRLNIFYRPEGYEPPSITEEDRIRDAFAMNTFYYQPENPFFGDHPMGDALMEMDAVDVILPQHLTNDGHQVIPHFRDARIEKTGFPILKGPFWMLQQ